MELTRIVEALLFASPDPLSTRALTKLIQETAQRLLDDAAEAEPPPAAAVSDPTLQALVNVTEEDIERSIDALNAHYDETCRAFELRERAAGWKHFSRGDLGDWVAALFPGKRPARLSAPALETLAIIAYRQPVTKAAMEAVRGVAVDGVLNKLLDRNLVRIAGRADLPGRPLLYETTDAFLDHFGIKHVDELPNSAELRNQPLPDGIEDSALAEEQRIDSETLSISPENTPEPVGSRDPAMPVAQE